MGSVWSWLEDAWSFLWDSRWGGATIAAVAFTIIWTEFRTRLNNRRQAKAARRMLSLEVNRNLELGRDLRKRLVEEAGRPLEELNWEGDSSGLAYVMFSQGKTPWSQSVWHSHVNVIASTIPGNQVNSLFAHHGHVTRLNEYHSSLAELLNAQILAPERPFGAPSRQVGIATDTRSATPFSDNAHRIMKPLVTEIGRLLALGNLIQEPSAFQSILKFLGWRGRHAHKLQGSDSQSLG